ncbi:hypothetical protein PoB_000471100 [Plakobranchus ocellatus]|uniref:Uncharacterized protein n=1 Tax=Plakobranchus ocellatus TaxID=259542 RepID=A0AAV3Y710_9GAST|nr:hypothetical protein PoB_000471100 [Plakobranchus ocellatus]
MSSPVLRKLGPGEGFLGKQVPPFFPATLLDRGASERHSQQPCSLYPIIRAGLKSFLVGNFAPVGLPYPIQFSTTEQDVGTVFNWFSTQTAHGSFRSLSPKHIGSQQLRVQLARGTTTLPRNCP